jgi:chromosome segregation ATPase
VSELDPTNLRAKWLDEMSRAEKAEDDAERLREERDGYRFDREALEGLCDTYKRDAERLRESEFNANAKAAILEGKCERLREALEALTKEAVDGHPVNIPVRTYARAHLDQEGESPPFRRPKISQGYPMDKEEREATERILDREGGE